MSDQAVDDLPPLAQELAGGAVEGALPQELEGLVVPLALGPEELPRLDVDPLLAPLHDHVAVLAHPELLRGEALAVEVHEAGLHHHRLVVQLQQQVLHRAVLEVAVLLALLRGEGGHGHDLALAVQELQLLHGVGEQAVRPLLGQVHADPVAVGDAVEHADQHDDQRRDEHGVSTVRRPPLQLATQRHRRLSRVL